MLKVVVFHKRFGKRKRMRNRMRKKRGVSYSYRTATTSYLCFVPDLEELEGAGRKRLTPPQK